MFEGDDQNQFEEEPQPEESSNRNFLIIAGILIGIVCLSVAGLGYYAMRVLPQQSSARGAQQETLVAQNLQVYQTLTQLAQSDMLSQTPAATATLPPTATPPIAQASATSQVAASTSDPQTATVAAALTQAAQAQLTVTFLPTSTALPTSGFADEAGLPGLVAMAIALVVVILLARRLRAAPTAK